jgi:hypothetical protein
MKIGRGNRSTRRKPSPAPLCPQQIPLDQTRDRTRAAAMSSQRLSAWAMARPWCLSFFDVSIQTRQLQGKTKWKGLGRKQSCLMKGLQKPSEQWLSCGRVEHSVTAMLASSVSLFRFPQWHIATFQALQLKEEL